MEGMFRFSRAHAICAAALSASHGGVNPPRQSIAIVGAGALGLYYGARLVQAGHEVRFLLRGDLAAIRERDRITVREKHGDFTVSPVQAFGAVAEIGVVDVVLITMKATANALLADLLPPLVGPLTMVVTLQNGLGNEEAVAAVVGAERTWGGLCFIGVNRSGPGEVRGIQTPGSIALGEFDRPAGSACRELADTFEAAGVPCTPVDSLRAARWRKLVWNIPFNGLTVVAGAVPCDELLRHANHEAEVRALMREIQATAAAEGVVIDDAFLHDNVERTRSMAYQPSTLIDFMEGRPLELEPIWGEPLRRARTAGVATPHLAALYDRLSVMDAARTRD